MKPMNELRDDMAEEYLRANIKKSLPHGSGEHRETFEYAWNACDKIHRDAVSGLVKTLEWFAENGYWNSYKKAEKALSDYRKRVGSCPN